MQNLWIFILISVVLIWILQRWRDRRHILLCTKFPTVWGHIISGFGYLLTTEGTVSLFRKIQGKYGKNIVCYVGPFPLLLTTDPEVVKDVFLAKHCTTKPYLFYGRLANAIGRGLITMSEPHWSNERKIVNVAFNNKNLMSFIPIFNEAVNTMLKNIEKDIAEGTKPPMVIYFRELTVRIATRTTIATDIDKTRFNGRYFAECMSATLEYAGELMLNNIYAVGFIRKLAQMTYFKKPMSIIEDMTSLITASFHDYVANRGVEPSCKDNINTAVEYMTKGVEQNRMKRDHVPSSLLHLYVGAFETTSTTLYYMLLMLGMYPEYQQRAYEEVCSIFPDDDDEEFEVSYEHLGQLVYIEMIMNETLRLLPLIPHAAREVVGRDLNLSNGVVLPKGQIVIIDIYSLHRSKEIWGPEADQFNPDNFLPSNIDSKHPYSYIPFTKGLRFCIGWRYAQLSIKLTMAKLIKRYKFTAHCKIQDLQPENHITLQLKENPELIVERRKKAKII